jgi:hypothetical protein
VNVNNPCRKDHPERKLVDSLMYNPWDDLEVHISPRQMGSLLYPGMDKTLVWKEIDAAVIEEMRKGKK